MYFDAHSDILSDVTIRRLLGETDVLRNRHLPRLRRGNVEGGIFVIWVDPPFDTGYAARTRQIMDCSAAELAQCGEAAVVRSFREIEAAVEAGKFYILLGVEGLAAIGEDVERIDAYYDFGCRHAMLTWNEQNALATGVKGDPDRGLTAAGRRAARRLQDKHMLVDVSHLNEKSFWDVMDGASAPVIASHSNAKALCGAARNLTDEQLRAVRDTGGVVGLNAFHLFLSDDPAQRTVETLARHAAHMAEVMGVDHVGCGFDFFEFLEGGDALDAVPGGKGPGTAGLEDCTKIPDLFACLERMGMTPAELEKIARGNFHRVLREVLV